MSVVYEARAPWIRTSAIQKFISKTKSRSAEDLYERAAKNTEWFWTEALQDIGLNFSKPYKQLLTSSLPWPKWADGGELSIVDNCIDRHLKTLAQKPAVIFEDDEEKPSRQFTYEQLARASSFITELLRKEGAVPGDRAALLMPMSPEMISAFFGILRAGLTVIPIFSGYGSDAVQARLVDGDVKFVFTQKRITRRGKEVNVIKDLEALKPLLPSLQKIFVLDREEIFSQALNHKFIPAVQKKSEDEVLLLYTSGTTGKPKACVHTSFGVLATTGKELRYAFDVREEDHFFWFTDIGWMMGPWEIFGVLQFGATVILFEGVPDYPDANRLWRILSKHHVTHLGISPTAIRVLKKSDSSFLDKTEFPNLRILGSTGEPWDEESWMWFFEKVGKKKCPIINISGGTEVMGCLLSPSPLDSLKPATLARPALGVRAEIWNENGEKLKEGLGHLVCLSPMPSMTKGFLHSKEKYLDTYFSKFGESVWYHGDWAFQDSDGFWFLRGRSDDTIKIAGKRVGPNEFESILMENPNIAEVAAVGLPHDVKGEGVHCLVVLKDGKSVEPEELKKLVAARLGKALAPEKILFVRGLPKTRSGKILRGVIRKILLSETFDPSAIENSESIEWIQKVRP